MAMHGMEKPLQASCVFGMPWLISCSSRPGLRGKRISLRVPHEAVAQPVPEVQPVTVADGGARLRAARRRLGYTQQMLADFAQVGIATIKRAERGEPLRVDTIGMICQVFSDRYHRVVEPEELGLQMSWNSQAQTLARKAV